MLKRITILSTLLYATVSKAVIGIVEPIVTAPEPTYCPFGMNGNVCRSDFAGTGQNTMSDGVGVFVVTDPTKYTKAKEMLDLCRKVYDLAKKYDLENSDSSITTNIISNGSEEDAALARYLKFMISLKMESASDLPSYHHLIAKYYDISGYESIRYPSTKEEFDQLEADYATEANFQGSQTVGGLYTEYLQGNNPFNYQEEPVYNSEKYMMIATGYLLIPSPGTYYFGIDGDDAVDFTVNGQTVVGWYGGHGKAGYPKYTGVISFQREGIYPIKLRMQEWTGQDNYYVYWKKPGDSSFKIIPSEYIFDYSDIGAQ